MNPADLPEEWSVLFNAMADETLTAEQEQRLADLLRTRLDFRQEFVRFCQLLTVLTWHAPAKLTDRQPSSAVPATPASAATSRRSWPKWATVAAIAAVLAILGVNWFGMLPFGDDSLGTVVNLNGRIGIARGKDAQVWMDSQSLKQNPWQLRPGDHLQTDQASSATLRLSDQSEIHLHPETQMTLTAQQGVTVTLAHGHLVARVTPQRVAEAMTFATSQAEVRVVGTELELLVATASTEIAVTEGRVRVTRQSDGSVVEVAAAQFLSVAETGELAVVDFPHPPDEWSEDFEQGLPRGWMGQFVRNDLSENARGAAAAVPVSHSGRLLREVGSPTQAGGLFAWHADSVLHLTFRVQPPEWFHLYLFARSYSGEHRLMTFCCVNPDLWQTSPGQWRTVSIPLSEFHSVTPGKDEPTLGRIPVRLAFSGEGGSVGVVIDRVWVDRGNASSAR